MMGGRVTIACIAYVLYYVLCSAPVAIIWYNIII